MNEELFEQIRKDPKYGVIHNILSKSKDITELGSPNFIKNASKELLNGYDSDNLIEFYMKNISAFWHKNTDGEDELFPFFNLSEINISNEDFGLKGKKENNASKTNEVEKNNVSTTKTNEKNNEPNPPKKNLSKKQKREKRKKEEAELKEKEKQKNKIKEERTKRRQENRAERRLRNGKTKNQRKIQDKSGQLIRREGQSQHFSDYINYINEMNDYIDINAGDGKTLRLKWSQDSKFNDITSIASVYDNVVNAENGVNLMVVDDRFFDLKPETQKFIMGHEMSHIENNLNSIPFATDVNYFNESRVDLGTGLSKEEIINALEDLKENAPEYATSWEKRIFNFKNDMVSDAGIKSIDPTLYEDIKKKKLDTDLQKELSRKRTIVKKAQEERKITEPYFKRANEYKKTKEYKTLSKRIKDNKIENIDDFLKYYDDVFINGDGLYDRTMNEVKKTVDGKETYSPKEFNEKLEENRELFRQQRDDIENALYEHELEYFGEDVPTAEQITNAEKRYNNWKEYGDPEGAPAPKSTAFNVDEYIETLKKRAKEEKEKTKTNEKKKKEKKKTVREDKFWDVDDKEIEKRLKKLKKENEKETKENRKTVKKNAEKFNETYQPFVDDLKKTEKINDNIAEGLTDILQGVKSEDQVVENINRWIENSGLNAENAEELRNFAEKHSSKIFDKVQNGNGRFAGDSVEKLGDSSLKKIFNKRTMEIGLNAVFAISDYKAAREEGKGVIRSLGKAGFQFVEGELLGGAMIPISLAKAAPKLAVKGIETAQTLTRQMNSVQRIQTFGDAYFQDTQQLATMRQAGMELAKMSQYNLQQSIMGNEAQYMKRF